MTNKLLSLIIDCLMLIIVILIKFKPELDKDPDVMSQFGLIKELMSNEIQL